MELVLKIVLVAVGILCLVLGFNADPNTLWLIITGVVLLALAGIWVLIVDLGGDWF